MDRLPPETQEQLKKSTTRIMLKLGQAGYDEDRLVGLESADLLEALAETIITKSRADQADPIRSRRRPRSVSPQRIRAVSLQKVGAWPCGSES